MEDNQKKNVTLYLNSALYEKYVEYCKKEGFMLSRQIEKFIEGELQKDGPN
jgi:hypothetical protein